MTYRMTKKPRLYPIEHLGNMAMAAEEIEAVNAYIEKLEAVVLTVEALLPKLKIKIGFDGYQELTDLVAKLSAVSTFP
jgi:hypothetical protein